jgi:membrane associated rhomboid family serine protease
MSMSQKLADSSEATRVPNGPGAAAILAAGIGCAMLGILALAGDASPTISKLLNFYNPTGTLSGVTAGAIIVWLVSWIVLNRQWRTRTINLAKINVVAFAALAIGLLLTFPPFMDMIQGK